MHSNEIISWSIINHCMMRFMANYTISYIYIYIYIIKFKAAKYFLSLRKDLISHIIPNICSFTIIIAIKKYHVTAYDTIVCIHQYVVPQKSFAFICIEIRERAFGLINHVQYLEKTFGCQICISKRS